jgi:hypothetical protein
MPLNSETVPLRRHSISHVETYEITADELDRLQQECMGTGQDLQFALVALTIGISCLVSLLLTTITSRRIFDGFLVFTIVGFVFAIYFGIQYKRKKRTMESVVQRVMDRQVGPVGEEGRELRPAELAGLPVTAATTGNVAPAPAEETAAPGTPVAPKEERSEH